MRTATDYDDLITKASANLDHLSDDLLLSEVERRFPDRVLMPREASSMMCLRAYQAENVFCQWDGVSEYLDTVEGMPQIKGVSDGNDYFGHDERTYYIIAAMYKGCISGYEEMQSRIGIDGMNSFNQSWSAPLTLPRTEDVTWPDEDQSVPKKSAFSWLRSLISRVNNK